MSIAQVLVMTTISYSIWFLIGFISGGLTARAAIAKATGKE